MYSMLHPHAYSHNYMNKLVSFFRKFSYLNFHIFLTPYIYIYITEYAELQEFTHPGPRETNHSSKELTWNRNIRKRLILEGNSLQKKHTKNEGNKENGRGLYKIRRVIFSGIWHRGRHLQTIQKNVLTPLQVERVRQAAENYQTTWCHIPERHWNRQTFITWLRTSTSMNNGSTRLLQITFSTSLRKHVRSELLFTKSSRLITKLTIKVLLTGTFLILEDIWMNMPLEVWGLVACNAV
jgi:hypothetical protein